MQDSLSWSSRLEGGLHESGVISCQSEKVYIWWFWLQGIETPTKSWTLHSTFKSERLNMVDGFKSLTRCEPKNKKTREPLVGEISSCLSPLRTLYLLLSLFVEFVMFYAILIKHVFTLHQWSWKPSAKLYSKIAMLAWWTPFFSILPLLQFEFCLGKTN